MRIEDKEDTDNLKGTIEKNNSDYIKIDESPRISVSK